jgi:hypothetical protein
MRLMLASSSSVPLNDAVSEYVPAESMTSPSPPVLMLAVVNVQV